MDESTKLRPAEEASAPPWQIHLNEMQRCVDETHEAVARGIPVYLGLLRDPDPSVGAAAACTLATLRGRAGFLAPVLRDELGEHLATGVKVCILLALGMLADGSPEYTAAYQAILTSAAPGSLRLAAAMALARAWRRAAPEESKRVLLAARDDPGWDQDLSSWRAGYVERSGNDDALEALHAELSAQVSRESLREPTVPGYVCAR